MFTARKQEAADVSSEYHVSRLHLVIVGTGRGVTRGTKVGSMGEQAVLLNQVDDATRRLLKTAGALTDEDIASPSLLPGWTRGHVLNHVARNAEALRNLLGWARTGVVTPAYPSQQARDDAIEAGADRPAAELAADIARTAAEFGAEAATLNRRAWQVPVHLLDGREFPAALILTRRLVEVELHHTDLGCGYRRADWPATFAAMDLPEPARSQRADRR